MKMNRTWLVIGFGAMVATAAPAAEVLTTSAASHTGEVVRVETDGIVFKIAMGEVMIRKSEVISVDVPQPESYAKAVTALEQRKYGEAVQGLKPLVDRLAGVDLEWIQAAVLKLGDAQVGAKNLTEAKGLFDRFRVWYPTSPKVVGLDAKYAAILVAQKKCPEALALLTKLTKPLLDKKAISIDEEQAVAEALVLTGDCQQSAGNAAEALQSYLTVVALFDTDASLAAEAKYKSAKIFEEQKNWKRAKGSYQELSTEAPQPDIIADSQRRLARLNEAHPE